MRRDIKNNLEKILNGEIKVFYGNALRLQIFKNNIFEYKCSKCNLNKWLEENISLEIDHIDGDHWNNKKENLRLLCPNCHSLTKNYRGKNIYSHNNTILKNKDKIINLIKDGNNINQTLSILDLKTGSNYKTVYKILKENNIELPKKEEKSILLKNLNKKAKQNRIKKIKDQILIIKNCGLDFNKKGWGKQLSILLNMSPSATLNFVKRNIPEFAKNCWKHKK